MKHDISWLVGRRIAEIEKMDYTWFFRLDDGSVIATESTWRVVTPKGVAVTSDDHEQKFGLPSPLDAAAVAKDEIGKGAVTGAVVDSRTGDLNIEFGPASLHFLCLSSGYESWRSTHGHQDLICTGGGKIAEFRPDKK